MLELTRPLIAIDCETTSTNPETARIIELGFKILYPDGKEPKIWNHYIHPETAIPPEVTALTGIRNEDVATAPIFRQLAPNLALGFKDCDYCGYNVRFDLRVLSAEMFRAGVEWSPSGAFTLDAMHLWRIAVPRTLTDAVREFLGRVPTAAHRALGDAEDALEVALAITSKFNLPKTVEELHNLCFSSTNVDPDGKFIWVNNEATCNFGKHKNTPIKHIPRAYLKWIIDGQFSLEVKNIARDAIEGKFPTR